MTTITNPYKDEAGKVKQTRVMLTGLALAGGGAYAWFSGKGLTKTLIWGLGSAIAVAAAFYMYDKYGKKGGTLGGSRTDKEKFILDNTISSGKLDADTQKKLADLLKSLPESTIDALYKVASYSKEHPDASKEQVEKAVNLTDEQKKAISNFGASIGFISSNKKK